MVARSRVRLRTRSGASPGAQAEKVVKQHLSAYQELEEEMDALKVRMESLKQEITETMENGKLTEVFQGVLVAKYASPATRSSTVIDPQKFSDHVLPEEFWDCISISVTKAREVMSERELKKVSTTSPGEPKPPVLTITRKKK